LGRFKVLDRLCKSVFAIVTLTGSDHRPAAMDFGAAHDDQVATHTFGAGQGIAHGTFGSNDQYPTQVRVAALFVTHLI
jgi:hypothetical protein